MKPDDRAVQELMAKQFGVISNRQVETFERRGGYTEWKLRCGEWVIVGRGVFKDAAAPVTWHQRAMAASLELRGVVALSHGTAAHLWGLDRYSYAPRTIDVTSDHQSRIVSEGVTRHWSLTLERKQIVMRQGLPVTHLPRTLMDLAMVLEPKPLEIVLDSAVRHRPEWRFWVRQELHRHKSRHRRGFPVLERLIDARTEARDGALEVVVEPLFAAAGLPPPLHDHFVTEGDRWLAQVDYAWVDEKLAIQAQSFQHHSGRVRFDRDYEQLSQLAAAGWAVLTPTWTAVEKNPQQFIALLKQAWAECRERRNRVRQAS